MLQYKRLFLAAALVCFMAYMLSACVVVTTGYGVPYGYGSSWTPTSDAGASRAYQHYRPPFDRTPLPSQFKPNMR